MDMTVADDGSAEPRRTTAALQSQELARHPMVVGLAAVLLAGLLAALGWLAVNVSDLKAGQERLKAGQEWLKAGQERISTENGAIRQDIDAIRQDIADLKTLMSSQPPAE